MVSIAVMFLGSDYTYLHLILLVLGTAIALLVASSISRLAYFTYRSHLVLEEIHKDIRRLVLLQSQKGAADDPSTRQTAQSPADPEKPDSQG